MFFSRIRNLILILISKIRGNVWYARRKGVKVGNNCRLYINSWGSEPFLIEIGDNVTVTNGVRFLTHDGAACLINDPNNKRYFSYAKITIGSNVFVGIDSVILPNVSIVDYVVIGAGSVVTRSITESGVYVGNPARKIKSFEDYKEKIVRFGVGDSELDAFENFKSKIMSALEVQDAKQSAQVRRLEDRQQGNDYVR